MREQLDAYERAVEEAIAICDGDAHGAIKALIMANEYLEAQLKALQMTADADEAGRSSTLH